MYIYMCVCVYMSKYYIRLKHWHVLKVNSKFKKTFKDLTIPAYLRNKNLKQIIGSNSFEHNKKTVKKKYYSKCRRSDRIKEQRCKQIIDTKSFKMTQTKLVSYMCPTCFIT